MKIIHKDIRKGIVKVRVQSLDELWYLSHMIDAGDLVSSRTQRKIKATGGGDDERGSKTIVRHVFLKISVEKVEFHKYADKLRVSGKIVEGPDDVPRGTYHTINIEPTVEFTLEKERWLKYQLEKLDDAAKHVELKVLIVAFDRESALFAQLKNYGFEIVAEIKGDVQKKDSPEQLKSSSFYREIVEKIRDYDQKHNLAKIIVASPAFWKEYLAKATENEPFRPKLLLASCNSVGSEGINEVLKRPEVATALKDDSVVREMGLVEEVLTEINKDGNVAYGMAEVGKAVSMGAVAKILVTDTLLHRCREQGTYEKLDRILRDVDNMKGEVHIISSEHEGGKKLDGLGGVAALLRYKM